MNSDIIKRYWKYSKRKYKKELLKYWNQFERAIWPFLRRPVLNESEPINVTFGLNLQQIVDLVRFSKVILKHLALEKILMLQCNFLGLLAKSKGVIICQSWPLWLLLLPHSAMMLHLCQKAPFHCTGVQDEKNQLLTTCMWFNLVRNVI